MTLALYGKSRKRQGGLLLAAFLAVIAASLGGIAIITSAFAHNAGLSATCAEAKVSFTSFASSGTGNGGKNEPRIDVSVDGGATTTYIASFTGASFNWSTPVHPTGSVTIKAYWTAAQTRDGHTGSVGPQTFTVSCQSKIIVKKVTINDPGSPNLRFSATVAGPGTAGDTSGNFDTNSSLVDGLFLPDSPNDDFTVTEGSLPSANWAVTGKKILAGDVSCGSTSSGWTTSSAGNASGGALSDIGGNTTTVCFRNEYTAPVTKLLKVCKIVENNNTAPTGEGGTFGFTVTGGASASPSLTRTEGQTVLCSDAISVVQGVATTVTETGFPAGWSSASGFPKVDANADTVAQATGNSIVVTVAGASCNNGTTIDLVTAVIGGADCFVTFTNKMGPVVQQFGTSTVGKTHSGDGTPNLGENFTYTITFTVAGGPLNGQKFFSDILPASLEFQGTPFGTQTDLGNFLTCTNTTTAVNCNLADLTPIGVYSQVVNVHVKTGATCGPVINNVKIGADTAQGDTVATDTVNVEGCGELGIEKSDSTQTVDAGANIVWTIGLRNSSVVPATAYVLDAGATLVAPAACTQAGGVGTVITCTVPASNGNSTPELLVTVKTAKPVQTGTQMCTPQDVTNTAYLVDSTTEITPSGADDPSDSGKFTIPATANANCIKVKKLAAAPGDWNITFTNSGPAADINFSDTYQDGGSSTDIVSIKDSANGDVAGCTPGQPFPDGTKQVSGCNLNLPNGVTVITVHTEVPANSCNGWKVGNTVAAFMGTGSPSQGASIPGDTTEADKTASASYSGLVDGSCFVISKSAASPAQDDTHVFWDISIKNNTAESQHVFVKDTDATLVSVSGGSCAANAGDSITNGIDCQVAAGATLIVKVSKAKNLQVCSSSASNSATIYLGSNAEGTIIGAPDGGTINYTNQSECTEIIEVCKFWRLSDGEVGGLPARDFDFQIQDSDTSQNFSLNVAEGQIGDCVNIEVARGDVTVSELPPGSGFVTTHKLNDADTEVPGASITFNTFECQPLEQVVNPLVQSIFSLVIDPPTEDEPICTVYFFNEDPGVSMPTGNLLIQKFLDINGDGDANDPGEHEIFGWGVTTDGPGLSNDHQVTVDEVTFNGILYVGLEHGDVYSVTEDLPAGWQITRATVNGANMGDSTNVNATIVDGGTTIVQFFNRQLGGISVHKTTVNVLNGIETVNTNDDDGWTITVKSALCGIDLALDTDANGNAVFSGLPMCTDYVVAEILASGEPGYSPVTPASVSGKTPTVGGNTQVNFTNETRSFTPPCPNCTPGTQTVPTPTPTPVTPVPPTATPCVGCNPGQQNAPTPIPSPTITSGSTPPVTAIAGEKTPGQTPIAPSTGEGGSGGGSGGLNLLLVLGGLGALAGGITFMAMGRKNRS